MATAFAMIPHGVAADAEVDDTFDTAVSESAGGISGRESIRRERIRQFHITVGPDDVDEMRAIHATHRRRWPCAIRDWASYIFTNQSCSVTTDATYVYAKLQRRIAPSTGGRFLT